MCRADCKESRQLLQQHMKSGFLHLGAEPMLYTAKTPERERQSQVATELERQHMEQQAIFEMFAQWSKSM